jgi:cyclase
MLMHHVCRFVIGFVMILSLCAFTTPAAQQPQQSPPLTVHNLRPNIYWIEGGVGNVDVIVGQKGLIVIDATMSPSRGTEVLAEIAKLTTKPVTHMLITHSDGDHVNGLAAFPKGMTIIAQENCKKEMEAAIAAGGKGAPPKDYLPTHTFAQKESLTIDGIHFQLLHFGRSHTSGDMIIYLPDQKIAFIGDIRASVSPDPIIHMQKNGSPAGWIRTMHEIIKLDTDTYVPGHGDVLTKANMQKEVAKYEAEDTQIKALVKQGKTLDEVKTAMGVSAPPTSAAGGRGGPRFPLFPETDYLELTKK